MHSYIGFTDVFSVPFQVLALLVGLADGRQSLEEGARRVLLLATVRALQPLLLFGRLVLVVYALCLPSREAVAQECDSLLSVCLLALDELGVTASLLLSLGSRTDPPLLFLGELVLVCHLLRCDGEDLRS